MSQTLSDYLENIPWEDIKGAIVGSDDDNRKWWLVENELEKILLAALSPFTLHPHINRSHILQELPKSPEMPEDISSIKLGAVNFRGLYRRNGRETLLVPCNLFKPKCKDVKKHGELHDQYMKLVGKAWSINQLFLASTFLKSLTVEFIHDATHKADIQYYSDHAEFIIPKKLSEALAPTKLGNDWTNLINWKLRENPPALSIRELTKECDKQRQIIIVSAKDLVRSNVVFFQKWLQMPFTEDTSLSRYVVLLEEWLWSLALLQFYCRPEHAGNFFYTVRLRKFISGYDDLFPDTSLSLVANERLSDELLGIFLSLPELLQNNFENKGVTRVLKQKFDRFVKERNDSKQIGDPLCDLYKALNAIYTNKNDKVLPLDTDKVGFLLRVARRLVTSKHEGFPLRFCFVFSFSRERIDKESGGLFEEIADEMDQRWIRFIDHCQVRNIGNGDEGKILGEAMVKWIQNNDLQLQRTDVAIFFEERAENNKDDGQNGIFRWPVPTSMIRMYRESHPVATIVQLRDALRSLTTIQTPTAAILTGETGLQLFYGGKCFLMPCNGREEWKDKLRLTLSGENPIETQIEETFYSQFREAFNKFGVTDDSLQSAAYAINKLCETLVALGHGAMFVIMIEAPSSDSSEEARNAEYEIELTPLNPVWCMNEVLSGEETKRDCTTYALMAALDGATEIILPRPDRKDQTIFFRCRKFFHFDKPVWKTVKDGQPGEAELCDGFHVSPIDLVGRGTRHHNALVLSSLLKNDAVVITVSSDGPVTLWENGGIVPVETELRYK